MAERKDISPLDENIARILGRSPEEISELLKNEFEVIRADKVDSQHHPENFGEFKNFANDFINNYVLHNDAYKKTLNKLVEREGPRRFYFYSNELDAVSRIFEAIENGSVYLTLHNLNLISLPPVIKKLRKLETLYIDGNKITELSVLNNFTNLRELNADSNPLTEISLLSKNLNLEVLSLNNCKMQSSFDFLQSLSKLRILYLNDNNINDTRVLPLLKIPSLEIINLSGKPLDTEPAILNDLQKIREHYNINIESTDVSKKTQENKNEIKGKATKVEPTEVKIEEKIIAQESSDASIEKPKPEDSKKEPEDEFRSYATGKISLMGSPERNLLDVEKLSKIFYDFIADCQDNSEQFFGLFGRWGRGKTHLWRYLRDHNIEKSRFIPVEFHAWKYQDTPGLWAYLYAELNKVYFEDNETNKNPVSKYYSKAVKLIRLNFVRGKILKPAFLFLSGILLSTLLFVILQSYTDWFNETYVLLPSLIGLVGINVAALVNQIEKYKDGAKHIISQITSNVNFRNQLGLQHEIQEELRFLLEAWIPKKQKEKKRILLFIDDIDRCSEDKIIQIVDYIRVLLDESEIQSRITILAAIDERILIHAIQNKYRKFVENKDNDATFKELCREYMDKLFLAGLKLGLLTGFEKDEMVEGFTKRYLKKEKEIINVPDNKEPPIVGQDKSVTGKSMMSYDTSKIPPSRKVITDVFEDSNPSINSKKETSTDTSSKKNEEEKVDVNREGADYLLEKWEQDFLKEIMEKNNEATPRSIRVYTFRYLLGKKLIEKPLKPGEPSWNQWYNKKDAKRCFALKLFHYTYKSDVDELNSKYRDFMTNYKDENQVNEKIYNFSLTLNQKLGSIMYQTLTMIVAY